MPSIGGSEFPLLHNTANRMSLEYLWFGVECIFYKDMVQLKKIRQFPDSLK